MSGWVKLHRSLLDWEWYDDHNTTRLFVHIVLKANHKPAKWRGNSIERGQTITSLESLSKETGLTISQIRTSINKLISTGEIASLSQARNRVITVLGYDSWQADDKQASKLIASSSQGSDNKQECKKNKNEDKTPVGSDKSLAQDAFNHWWKMYPKKQAKGTALKAWEKITKGKSDSYIEDLTNHITADITKRMRSLESGDKKYLGFDNMNGSTYINQERYNDE